MKSLCQFMLSAMLVVGAGTAMAAEGAATGNGTSTPAGPASSAKSPGMSAGGSSAGGSMSAPSKSEGGPSSKGESNGTSTPAGAANK